ncbi:uncharacterized protein L969DRAFT_16860 [Mixia osmundae IAM 14324]|uniref:Uncharacterized protein n=1 Tax=Mixia osmundae (strain CBS 9802 / IAM 14324 / JCM 22182 / KY 12970) TaxID=764103 RepID=G7E8T8_MIXOS|nr:uncharacterized protein L969DRAFT_16860 [Mixia osmundae IAM 14324]KEI40192.1 hypothetical protein L969DRAFT_16860 [Mixia osmundae IAM 14324]GAA99556.1 hypothetical protein E5Q_06257 [Mixia osmundae IAM 14324]
MVEGSSADLTRSQHDNAMQSSRMAPTESGAFTLQSSSTEWRRRGSKGKGRTQTSRELAQTAARQRRAHELGGDLTALPPAKQAQPVRLPPPCCSEVYTHIQDSSSISRTRARRDRRLHDPIGSSRGPYLSLAIMASLSSFACATPVFRDSDSPANATYYDSLSLLLESPSSEQFALSRSHVRRQRMQKRSSVLPDRYDFIDGDWVKTYSASSGASAQSLSFVGDDGRCSCPDGSNLDTNPGPNIESGIDLSNSTSNANASNHTGSPHDRSVKTLPRGWSTATSSRTKFYATPVIIVCSIILALLIVVIGTILVVRRSRRRRAAADGGEQGREERTVGLLGGRTSRTISGRRGQKKRLRALAAALGEKFDEKSDGSPSSDSQHKRVKLQWKHLVGRRRGPPTIKVPVGVIAPTTSASRAASIRQRASLEASRDSLHSVSSTSTPETLSRTASKLSTARLERSNAPSPEVMPESSEEMPPSVPPAYQSRRRGAAPIAMVLDGSSRRDEKARVIDELEQHNLPSEEGTSPSIEDDEHHAAEDEGYHAHIATDDKAVLQRIAQLASEPTERSSSPLSEQTQHTDSPSAPPLSLDHDGFESAEPSDCPATTPASSVHSNLGSLPLPSRAIRSTFASLTSSTSPASIDSMPETSAQAAKRAEAQAERLQAAWQYSLEPSAPPTLEASSAPSAPSMPRRQNRQLSMDSAVSVEASAPPAAPQYNADCAPPNIDDALARLETIDV